MKACFKCGVIKPYTDFYKHAGMADGHLGKCKECAKVDVRKNREVRSDYYQEYDRKRNTPEKVRLKTERNKEKYHTDPLFRESVYENRKKWLGKNPHKRSAQVYLGNAVRDGRIFKPSVCSHCNEEKRIQGHHWSYEREHWLDVIWLCAPCHGKEHRRLNDLGRDPDKIT